MTSGPETIEAIRLLFTAFNEIGGSSTLAGVILTDSSYEKVRTTFGPSAKPYEVSGVSIDLAMEHSFIVDDLLILRGTRS